MGLSLTVLKAQGLQCIDPGLHRLREPISQICRLLGSMELASIDDALHVHL